MRRKPGKVFFVVFGLFWIVGGSVLFSQAKKEQTLAEQMTKWPLHPAKIISAEVVEERERRRRRGRTRDRTHAYPRIVFSYEVDGNTYRKETTKPFYSEGSGYGYANAMVNRYRAGKAAKVHVNPANPAQAELEGTHSAKDASKSKRFIGGAIGFGVIMCSIGVFRMIFR